LGLWERRTLRLAREPEALTATTVLVQEVAAAIVRQIST